MDAMDVVEVESFDPVLLPTHTTPVILSWGRADTNTLLRGGGDQQTGISTAGVGGSSRTILQIASNLYHTAAVTSTGEVYTCGANDDGQIHPSSSSSSSSAVTSADIKPKIVEELNNHRICMVSCGLYHSVCLTASGLAVSFGGNEAGQCGHSASTHSRVLPKVVDFHVKDRNAVVVKQVACGDMFTLFLATSGEVYSCGIGAYTGISGQKDSNCAHAGRIDALLASNVVSVAAGGVHALAVTASGEVYAWGSGRHGQLGLGDGVLAQEDAHVQSPVRVVLPPNIGKVRATRSCGRKITQF